MLRKIILGVVGIAIITALCFIFIPMYYVSSCGVDPERHCYSTSKNWLEYREDRRMSRELGNLAQAQPSIGDFPREIGNYVLEQSQSFNDQRCYDFVWDESTNNIAPLEKGICGAIYTMTYREISGRKIVKVTIVRALKGKEEYLKVIRRFIKPEDFEGYTLGRMIDNRLAWFPKSGADFLTVHEGSYTTDSYSNITTTFDTKATPANIVAAYFLDRFPPVE